jgi:hypothetical protein
MASPHGSSRIWQRPRSWQSARTGLLPRRRTPGGARYPMPRLVPHTVRLCIHCRHNPAGFWVSRTSDQTVRRPWCLSCCQDLDPACHHVKPFDP